MPHLETANKEGPLYPGGPFYCINNLKCLKYATYFKALLLARVII